MKKRCGSCIYRTKLSYYSDRVHYGCDYIGMTGKPRPCTWEDCTEYIEGKPKGKKVDAYGKKKS